MNRFNPGKLLNSKWTALQPTRREKHFLVTEIELDEAGGVVACTIEAVLSRRSMPIAWQDLRDASRWAQGWK
jgi:tryptophan-rich hypothetical protein